MTTKRVTNQVIIEGKIYSEVRKRQIKDYIIYDFSVGRSTHKVKDEWQMSYFNVKAFNSPEVDGDGLVKGAKVYIKGTLRMDSWIDKNTQKKKTSVYIMANEITYLAQISESGAVKNLSPQDSQLDVRLPSIDDNKPVADFDDEDIPL